MAEIAAAVFRQFLLFTAVLAPLEILWPARPGQMPWRRRGLATDLLHFALNPFLISALAGATLALLQRAVGRMVPEQPFWLQFVEVLVLSETAAYWIHRWSHRIRWMWRFHAVHHTAEELDWVAAHRQHPFEATWMLAAANLPAMIIGFSTESILGFILFQKLYTAFLHANVRVGYGPLDRWLASPRFHHWHHDGSSRERSRNFAGFFPWLDRLFGTYELPTGFPQRYGCDVPQESWPRQMVRPFRT